MDCSESAIVPRILNLFLRKDRTYVLYGFHYFIQQTIVLISNSVFYNRLFGDSSAIVYYARWVGYRLNKIVQTGSNFGMSQRHENPFLCDIGSGTMVSGGLKMMNETMSSSSFKLGMVKIGDHNYLGNYLHFPADAKIGANVLVATKALVPIDGPIRENVGLLGSPCFEIPRATDRDKQMSKMDDATRRRQLQAKNRYNLMTGALYLLSNWFLFFGVSLCWLVAIVLLPASRHECDLHRRRRLLRVHDPLVLVRGKSQPAFRQAARPKIVPVLDEYFWFHERVWKLTGLWLIAPLFSGTPFKNLFSRLEGVRLGKKVFDDGAYFDEYTLIEIGDYTTLNAACVIQPHSLEEAVFKSDRVKIGTGCTLGVACNLHYGVTMGDYVVIEPNCVRDERRDRRRQHHLARKSGESRYRPVDAQGGAGDIGGVRPGAGGVANGRFEPFEEVDGEIMRALLRLTSDPPASGNADRPLDFHRRLPGYRETPLVEAPRLAEKFGVAKVYVKDETSRFGLPSFKVLGASWATYAALRERLGPIPDGPVSYESLQSWASPARPLTLLAATDGNHGRAVARVARWLGLKARIFLPTFVAAGRRQAIQAEGAELAVIDGVYDASVDAAVEASREPGTLLISDTARSASDVIPQLVTAGYTTAFAEIEQQLSKAEDGRIDVVAVQAGVGGLATAGTSWARLTRRGRSPRVVVVEPEPAACVMAALAAGEPIAVSASEVSAMSVLQCGTISLTAFATLNAGVSCCLAIEDSWAKTATDELLSCGVRTGFSGAAGAAGLLAALTGPLAGPLRQHLAISSDARLLVVATESAAASEHVAQAEMLPA